MRDKPTCPVVDDSFGYWLSGLADGEGSFNIVTNNVGPQCCFHIGLRLDDIAVLNTIRDTLKMGNVYTEKARPSHGRDNKPACRWMVQAQTEHVKLAELFRRYPLKTKKARDFEIWAQAADYMFAHPMRKGAPQRQRHPGRDARDAYILALKEALEGQRRYMQA